MGRPLGASPDRRVVVVAVGRHRAGCGLPSACSHASPMARAFYPTRSLCVAHAVLGLSILLAIFVAGQCLVRMHVDAQAYRALPPKLREAGAASRADPGKGRAVASAGVPTWKPPRKHLGKVRVAADRLCLEGRREIRWTRLRNSREGRRRRRCVRACADAWEPEKRGPRGERSRRGGRGTGGGKRGGRGDGEKGGRRGRAGTVGGETPGSTSRSPLGPARCASTHRTPA